MKRTLLLVILIVLGWSMSTAGVSFDLFYSSLSPHGEWLTVGAGTYAWRPMHMGVGWRPYLDGRWMWTDDGWYWASDEPWGWATYHYGRWYYDDYYGWVWVPGYDWAPAWVEWRYGGDYIGWAPLGPYAIFSASFGIHYNHYWSTPYNYWSFVDCRYMNSHNIHRYVYRSEDNARLIGRTRGGGNVQYSGGRVVTRGPGRDYVERRGNLRLPQADIVSVADRRQAGIIRTGGRERIEAYRPNIDGSLRAGAMERPGRVRDGERSLNLDTRTFDVRARDQARLQGRDLQRAEQYRNRELTDTRRLDAGRVWTGRAVNPDRRGYDRMRGYPGETLERPAWRDRRAERAPEPRQGPIDRPPRHSDRRISQSPGNQVFGSWGRSGNPERVIRRSESRPPEGGRGGGRRGGR